MEKDIRNLIESVSVLTKKTDGLTDSVSVLTKKTDGLADSVSVLTKTTGDLTESVSVLTKTTSDLTESVDIISKTTLKILETMATKEELALVKTELKSDIGQVSTKLDQVESDLKSFKVETRERFDAVDKHLGEIDENISGVVEDYHPRIIALEEKVFGHSTLAEA